MTQDKRFFLGRVKLITKVTHVLSVLILDDEKKVSLLIKKLIRWEELNLSFLDILDNGQLAYEYMKSIKPDIVVSDIRMPEMDGLQLIEAAKTISPKTRFILVSGYKQFEYARTALRFGVEDYLLKPISAEELNNSLKRISDEINKEKSLFHFEQQTLQDIEKSKFILYSEMVERLLSDKLKASDLQLDYKLKLNDENYKCIAIRLDSNDPLHYDAKQDRMILEWLNRKCVKESKGLLNEFVCGLVDQKTLVCILNYRYDQEEEIEYFIDQLILPLRDYIGGFNDFSITLGVSDLSKSLIDLRNLLIQSLSCIEFRRILGTNKIIKWYQLNVVHLSGLDTSMSIFSSLESAVININSTQLETVIQSFLMNPKANFLKQPIALMNTAIGITNIVFNLMPDNSPSLQTRQQDLISALKGSNTTELLIDLLISQLTKLLNEFKESHENIARKPIRTAKQYIEANYASNITLEMISERVELNPTYFSTLFKQETGMNFSAFLISVRMDAAKLKLRTTNHTIEMISYSVGYKDVQYFSKLFTTQVGLKPTQYRKLYG